MFPTDSIRAQLPHALRETQLEGLGSLYRGKVRDNYRRGDRLIMVATDRLSAFDHVLTTIPFKGEVLTRLAAFWFEKSRDVAPNHLLDWPDPNVLVCRACRPLPVEIVVRGYLTGSLWRDYEARRDPGYDQPLDSGLRRDQRFERPLVTPSTKAEHGQHDLPISEAQILSRGLVEPRHWEEAREIALALFERGQAWARGRGLILVDTKYEMGLDGDRLVVIDEMHTPDSSRYWVESEYEQRFAKGEPQRMLDKENIRQWLIQERGFSGHGPLPEIPDDVRLDLAQKYLSAFEQLTGDPFPGEVGELPPRLERNLRAKGYLSLAG